MSTVAKIPRTAEVYTKRETDIAIQRSVKPIKRDVESLLFAQYYPDGNVKSATEFTQDIKYDDPDTTNRTITVKPFSITGDSANDNSGLVGRVVIPPFVDAQGNPYISDDGTRFKVVGVSDRVSEHPPIDGYVLTAVIAPNTVITIGVGAFSGCAALASISFPAVTDIRDSAFIFCDTLISVSLPAAESIGILAFGRCHSLTSVDFGDTPRSSVPILGSGAFSEVPTSCKIIVPDAQYDAWTAATLPDESSNPWYALVTAGYKFLKHSEWEYARKYEVSQEIQDAIDGIKPTRIYNSAGTDALDDKGGLHKSDIVQSSWTLKKSGTATTYTFSYAGRNAGNNPNLFWWAQDGQNYSWMTYNPTTGAIDYVAGGTLIHTNLDTTEYGLDPSTGDVLPDISGITIKMFPNWATISGDLTFSPTQVRLLSESYTHLAVESVPTRTIAAYTVYAVGDLLGDDGKAYRCIQEYTSDATPVAPSSDTTHWVEIPVLSQKADKDEDATFGNLAKFDNDGNPVDSGILSTNVAAGVTTRLGASTTATTYGTALGRNTKAADKAVAIGACDDVLPTNASGQGSVAVGFRARVEDNKAAAISIGAFSKAKGAGAIAIGGAANDSAVPAIATADGSVQIGPGTNGVSNSLKFRDTMVVGGDGKVPETSLHYVPALESVPEQTVAASTSYAVGAVVVDSGKAYRCKSAYTSAATPEAPSADTGHWTEVPVLSSLTQLFAGRSMPQAPTQNEVAEVVKEIFKALGGTISTTSSNEDNP